MIRKIFFFIWLALIVLFTISPYSFIGKDLLSKTSVIPSGFFQHVFGYFILGITALYTFEKKRNWFYLVVLFVFGAFLELVQYKIPSRTFNLYDVLGNGIGLVAAGLFKKNNRV